MNQVTSQVTTTTKPSSFLRVFLPSFVIIFFMGLAWVLASPIYSPADENAHASKAIAVVRGELVGDRVEGVRHLVVDLPEAYSYQPQIICFVTRPDVAADCGVELGDDGGTPWFGNWVATYNPTYYVLTGWPSLLLEGNAGIYAIRIASVALGAVLLAWAFQLASAARRSRWMFAALTFFVSPMIIYMTASVNPQGTEIAAAAALWVGLIRLLESFEDRNSVYASRRLIWAVVVVSSMLLVTVRSLGPLWLLLIVASAFVIMGVAPVRALFSNLRSYAWLAPIAAAGIFSIVWTLGAGTLSGQAETTDGPLVNGTFLQGAWAIIRNTPAYLEQAAGVFGWLDTGLPSISYSLIISAVVLLVALAVLGVDRRATVVVAGLLVAALFVPAVIQGASVAKTGLIWQGRYGIPLYLGVVVAAGWFLSGPAGKRLAFLSVKVTAAISVLMAMFELVAFVIPLWRYVVGLNDPITTMISAPEWQPPGGWPIVAALAVVSISAFAAWNIRLAVLAARDDSRVV